MKVSQTHLSYPLRFVELTDEGVIFEDDKFKVSFQRLDHRIECVGYRIEEKDHPGELLIDKLRAEHVPSVPIYGRIKAGEVVTLPDGRTLDGKDYIGEPQKGRIITILGDTRQAPGILELAQGADVLVHESTFGKGESKLARNYYHSTCIQATKIANKVGVKQLLLNHISARYVGPLATQLQKDAASIFSNVKVVKDFDVIDVPFKKKGEKKLMTGYKQLKDLTNRVVLITGASSGLGEQVAYQVAKQGAIVVGCARRKDKLEKVMAVCRAISGRLAYAYQLDVSHPHQIEKSDR